MKFFPAAHVNVCLVAKLTLLIIVVHAEGTKQSKTDLAKGAIKSPPPSGTESGLVLSDLSLRSFLLSRDAVPHSSETANVTDIESYFADLKDHKSILQKADLEITDYPANWVLHRAPLLERQTSSGHLDRVTKSIVRVLNFVDHHVDLINQGDVALALSFAKVYDDKHGGYFQNTFDLTRLNSQICSQQTSSAKKAICQIIQVELKRHSGSNFPETTLTPYMKSLDSSTVGTEPDLIEGRLNGICQGEFLRECQVRKECEEKYFAPEPFSQYMLTHQLLQRIFAESVYGTFLYNNEKDCSSGKGYLNETVNHCLCSKMYMEAQFVSYLKYPELLRDVFAEYVGFCGYMGYPNFYRGDWLDAILSWQSKSDDGCFIREDGFDDKYFTSDVPLKRRQTKNEIEEGVQSKEMCRPHFTAVNLMALLGYWDYLMDQN